LDRELKEELTRPPLEEQWKLVQKLIAQDTEPDPEGGGGRRITDGVAKDRRISVSDPDMRHGRKSKRKRIDGYKRHIAVDVDTPGLICGVAVTPANQPERVASAALLADLNRHRLKLSELFIDRGYLGDESIEGLRQQGLQVHCKPFPLRNGDRFDKGDFEIDIDANSVRCPEGIVVPLRLGANAHFPAHKCDPCPKREACTRAKPGRGRSLSIHPNEPFMLELRGKAKSVEGRANLRTRVKVEHGLATLRTRQGERARYRGLRKNLFDVRRHAAVENLFVIDRLQRAA
jgi:IS5 family transposase